MSPDTNSLAGNQQKLLKRIVSLLFERQLLAEFTWSGKSNKGTQKVPMKTHKNIVELLYGICTNIDQRYQYDTFLSHLKNKILKYAYE